MASENGRSFVADIEHLVADLERATTKAIRDLVADLERATAQPRRAYGQVEEMLAAAEAKIAATQERLGKFATAMAEATISGSRPPQAAVALERDLADASKTVAACQALLPERKRLLQEAEARWVAENQGRMGEVFTQLGLEVELAMGRAWHSAHQAAEGLYRGIQTVAPEFARLLPGGPDVSPKLQLLESTVAAWTGNPARPVPQANAVYR